MLGTVNGNKCSLVMPLWGDEKLFRCWKSPMYSVSSVAGIMNTCTEIVVMINCVVPCLQQLQDLHS